MAVITTTELAAQLTSEPRFHGHDNGLFDELAAIHGRDITGIAYIQAALKIDHEREQVRASLAKRYGWDADDITDEMADAVLAGLADEKS